MQILTRRHANRGFTRVESIVAVAVVAILASLALPSHGNSVRRGRIVEARTELAAFGIRMEQSYQTHGGYGKGSCAAALPTAPHFVFSCTLLNGGQNFRGSATGRNQMAGYAYSIDDQGRVTADAAPEGVSVVAMK